MGKKGGIDGKGGGWGGLMIDGRGHVESHQVMGGPDGMARLKQERGIIDG